MKIENSAQKTSPIATIFLIILKYEISFNYDNSLRLDGLYKKYISSKILFSFENFDGLRANENLLSQMERI